MRAIQASQYHFITSQFHIRSRSPGHQPDERVEPVDARRDGEDELQDPVEAADMGQFVDEDVARRVGVPPRVVVLVEPGG